MSLDADDENANSEFGDDNNDVNTQVQVKRCHCVELLMEIVLPDKYLTEQIIHWGMGMLYNDEDRDLS